MKRIFLFLLVLQKKVGDTRNNQTFTKQVVLEVAK